MQGIIADKKDSWANGVLNYNFGTPSKSPLNLGET
jgi:hypothetical protein